MTPDLITSEMVEKAARAMVRFDAQDIADALEADLELREGAGLWIKHKAMAQAAIAAVLPSIVEACAKVVDSRLKRAMAHAELQTDGSIRRLWFSEAEGHEDCAARIRSLSPPTTKEK